MIGHRETGPRPGIPGLSTTRLVLRAFRPGVAAALHRILGGENVLRYFPRSTTPTLEATAAWIASTLRHWEERGFGLWAVESPDGVLMGRCGLQVIPGTDEIEIDYLLGPAWWGKGMATEAARAALRFGFEEKGMERIVGIVHVDNLASARVLEKLGMEREAEREYFGMACYRYGMHLGEARIHFGGREGRDE